MALVKCVDCRNDVSTEAKTCPKCGAAVRSAKNRASKVLRLGWYVVCAFVLLVVFRVFYQVGGATDRLYDQQINRATAK